METVRQWLGVGIRSIAELLGYALILLLAWNGIVDFWTRYNIGRELTSMLRMDRYAYVVDEDVRRSGSKR